MSELIKFFLIFIFIFFLILNLPGEVLAEERPEPGIEITMDSWGNVVVRMTDREDSTVFQAGNINFSLQLGYNYYNFSSVLQAGSLNFSSVVQEGKNNRAQISQSGKGNTAVIQQSSGTEDNKEDD